MAFLDSIGPKVSHFHKATLGIDRIVWLPQAGEWSKQYFWQRCGFAVAAAIDFPLLQLTAIGIALRLLNYQSNKMRTTTAFESIESGVTSNELHAAPTTSIA